MTRSKFNTPVQAKSDLPLPLARKATMQRVEGIVYREFQINRQAVVDEENRIVRLSFSSEYPVERMDWWNGKPWIEILGHADGEVNLGRMENGAAVLYGHSWERGDRVGVVQRVWIENGKGHADVRFSKREDINDIWLDVRDEILVNVSVGYFIHVRQLIEDRDGVEVYRVVDWEPYEISFVPIPADPTVGLGRGLKPGQNIRVIDLPQRQERKIMKTKGKRGAQLGAALDEAISALESEDNPRDTILAALAEAAGMEVADVETLVSGGEMCPTMAQLEAFADVLSADVSALAEAAQADGCELDSGGGETQGSDGDRKRKRTMKTNAAGASGVDTEFNRQREIRRTFKPHRERLGQQYDKLLDECLDDVECSTDSARAKLLDRIGQSTTPAGGEARIMLLGDSRDKFKEGARAALLMRSNILKPTADHGQNEFRGFTLYELARHALELQGVRTMGLDKMSLVGRAFTTSDFQNILADVMNKAVLLGYEEAPETWQTWCITGSLADFKTAKRVGLSEFNALEEVSEDGEYKYGIIGDRGENILLATYGKLFRITRKTIINDDLGALTEIPNKMGRAASRTIGDIAYAQLTSNPTLSDGVVLFHATHNNLNEGGAGAPSIDRLSAMRAAMALQKDSNNAAHGLNIRPGFVLVPVGLKDATQQLVASQYDPRTTVNNQIPNPVRNIGDVVDDPRLDADSATAWYVVAMRGFDTVEVAFLDGQQTPTIEEKDTWSIDGVEMKVRIDAGAAPRDFRTFQKNNGV